jgi:peptide/nickel transport system ATP-binding protein
MNESLQNGKTEPSGAQEADLRKNVLVEVKDLKMHFPIQKGFFKRVVGHVRAVDGISFFIRKGETLGLVGESGCGKTTAARCIMRAYEPTAGEVWFRQNGEMANILKLSRREMGPVRRQMQIIFQDPYSSLNPRMTIMDIIAEPLTINGMGKGADLKAQVRELLEAVGLRAQHMNRYPYAFSGGQRQRIGIARALALRPKLVICDEPVSALDVSIQAQTLNLLEDLQKEFGLTYLFVAHDLSVVEHISDRVAVMYLGDLVELANADELYCNPVHPYTEALLSAVPRTDPDAIKQRIILQGDVPSPANPPSGCKFHPRCRYTQERCEREIPEWRELTDDHWVACHRAAELKLVGIIYG